MPIAPARKADTHAARAVPLLELQQTELDDLWIRVGFGSPISFDLSLSGTPGGSIGDVFTLSFFNSGFTGGLLTGNVNDDWLAQFQIDTHGNITPVAFANPSGGPSFATITEVAATPEPASGLLLAAALAGIFGLGRRRRQ